MPTPRRRTLLVAALLSLTGCINPPGALRLDLATAQPVFASEEPISMTAKFSSAAPTICICKPQPHLFDVQLTNLDNGETKPTTQVVRCGGAFIFFPYVTVAVVASACLLDVADLAGRFVVLRSGHDRTFTFQLQGHSNDYVALTDLSRQPPNPRSDHHPLPPGHYRLHMSYHCESFLAPLFWRVYDQPVSATVDFTVARAS